MSKVKVEVVICKEVSEVFPPVSQLIKAIRAKKTVAEIAAMELPLLVSAVEGFDQMKEELKEIEMHDTVALGVASITKELVAPAAQA